MGLEAKCRASAGALQAEGNLQFEGNALLFRGGDLRLNIPRASMKRIEAVDGELRVEHESGEAAFALGAAAAKWADKVTNPPSLLDKLGVKPGMSVSLMGRFEDAFTAELRSCAEVAERPRKESAVVLLLAPERAGLDKIAAARQFLREDGGLWIVYPKGIQAITEMNVLEAVRAAGLKDNKVCSFSATHTALRFVVPVAARQRR